MSVQKYVIGQKKGGYTAVPNHVIKGLKDYALIGLYLYLIHLPEGWEFHKSQLQKQGAIGRDKLDKLLDRLEAHGLIKTAQKRGMNGRFSHFVMDVFDGSEFIIIDLPEEKKLSTAPFTEKPLTENRLLVNSIYKRKTYKTKKETKEIKSSCASRPKKPEPKAEKPQQYEPLPENHFLKPAVRSRENARPHSFAASMNRQAEVRSTVPEYGPGHPTWEMNEKWRRERNATN